MRNGALAVVLVGAMAAPASAAVGWLERLSGPGPFFGIVVPVSFACFGEDMEGPSGEVRLYSDYDCLRANTDRVRIVFGAELGRLWSVDNDLPYQGRPPGDGPGVRVLWLIGTGTLPLTDYFSLGAGAGAVRFSGEDDAFEAFWTPAVQPLRVALRPISPFTDDVRAEAIQVYFNLTLFTGGYEAADFGAIGPFREGTELVPQYGIFVDVVKLVMRPPARRSR